jgi:hypothetical protein
MKSIKKEFIYGIEYRNEQGKLHREDGPAVEYKDGTKYWLINGKFHRLDGPAVEYPNSDREWWINGKEYLEENYYQEIVKIKLKRILDL